MVSEKPRQHISYSFGIRERILLRIEENFLVIHRIYFVAKIVQPSSSVAEKVLTIRQGHLHYIIMIKV